MVGNGPASSRKSRCRVWCPRDKQTLLNEQARAKWQERATVAYDAAAVEWDAVVSALHPEETPHRKSPHHVPAQERKRAAAAADDASSIVM